jgi:ketosteroid isomerase-like protein
MSNLQTVQTIYEAFGRGDVPTILEKLADDVDWDYAYRRAPNPIPWLQARRGRAGAAAFFESIATGLDVHSFAPKVLLEGQGVVMVIFDIECTVKRTGKRIVENDEAHIWYFDDQGKVSRFRHCADTYQQVMALEG